MPFLHKPKKREAWQKWAVEKTCRTGWRNKIFYPEGGYYKGEWGHGHRSGKGVQLLPSGLQYEGDWMCDKKHGFGIRAQYNKLKKKFDLLYLGDYENDKMHGYGNLHMPNGDFFEGELKNDKRQGFGRNWFSDGSYYEGYWVKDMKHGYGMFVQVNGNRYEGQWRNDQKHGWGIFYHFNTGQKQIGFWENELCITSTIEDIPYRQSALKPTPYPIQELELNPNTWCIFFLNKAKQMLLQYSVGCQLHKYCYKISPPKSRKEFTQDGETNLIPSSELHKDEKTPFT